MVPGRICEEVPGIHPRNPFCSQCLFLGWPTSGNFTAFTMLVFNQSVDLDFCFESRKTAIAVRLAASGAGAQ